MKIVASVAVVLVLTAAVVWSVFRNGRDPVTMPIAEGPRKLRVCADPNNLPFSNERLQGFENRIAEVLARDLKADLEYTWWAQRRGYIRNTLRAGECDLIVGISTAVDVLLTTAPYYRSSYVFVTRRDRGIHVDSFDSPELKKLTIGVQVVGDDYANTPPVHALANRGIVTNIRGYRITDDYSKPNPPARVIEAVANGEVDIAVAWGPLAGYFAKRHYAELAIRPVSPEIDLPFLPFVFDIGLGVRRGEDAFRNEIEAAMERNRETIDGILEDYGVPRLDKRAIPATMEKWTHFRSGTSQN
jgi:mxaJ protein